MLPKPPGHLPTSQQAAAGWFSPHHVTEPLSSQMLRWDCPTATPKADPYSILILLLPWAAFDAPIWEVLSALGVQGTSHSSHFSLVFPESFFSTCLKMSPSVTLLFPAWPLFPAAAPYELRVHPHEFRFSPHNCALSWALDLYVFITTSCTSQTNFIGSSLPSTPNHLFMLKSYCVQTWESFLPPPSMVTYQVIQSLQWILNSYPSFHLHCMSHSASGFAHRELFSGTVKMIFPNLTLSLRSLYSFHNSAKFLCFLA